MAEQLLNQALTTKDSFFDFDTIRFPKESAVYLRKFNLGGKTYSVVDSISREKVGENVYREVNKVRVKYSAEIGYVAVEHHLKPSESSDVNLSSSANWEVVLISGIEHGKEGRTEALKIAKYTPASSAGRLEEQLAVV